MVPSSCVTPIYYVLPFADVAQRAGSVNFVALSSLYQPPLQHNSCFEFHFVKHVLSFCVLLVCCSKRWLQLGVGQARPIQGFTDHGFFVHFVLQDRYETGTTGQVVYKLVTRLSRNQLAHLAFSRRPCAHVCRWLRAVGCRRHVFLRLSASHTRFCTAPTQLRCQGSSRLHKFSQGKFQQQ